MEHYEDYCTCCGTDLDFSFYESSHCLDCHDNQYATDRWSERDSMMQHDSDLEKLTYYNPQENNLIKY